MDILSTHDVARFCKVTPRTVLRWVDSGILPGYQTGGGRRRVQREDLLRFMKERGMEIPEELFVVRNRIALVDDDALHVKTMERALRAFSTTLDVRSANDGFAAGALLYSFRPHLVFLDLIMPGMDGFEVCRRIRADPEFEGVGICVVSGHLTPVVKARLRELGADECLAKPFRRADLEPLLQRFVPDALPGALSDRPLN